jgi:hypothetical protein
MSQCNPQLQQKTDDSGRHRRRCPHDLVADNIRTDCTSIEGDYSTPLLSANSYAVSTYAIVGLVEAVT